MNMKLPGKTLLPDGSSASSSNDGQMVNEYIDCYTENIREGSRKHRHCIFKVPIFIYLNAGSTEVNITT